MRVRNLNEAKKITDFNLKALDGLENIAIFDGFKPLTNNKFTNLFEIAHDFLLDITDPRTLNQVNKIVGTSYPTIDNFLSDAWAYYVRDRSSVFDEFERNNQEYIDDFEKWRQEYIDGISSIFDRHKILYKTLRLNEKKMMEFACFLGGDLYPNEWLKKAKRYDLCDSMVVSAMTGGKLDKYRLHDVFGATTSRELRNIGFPETVYGYAHPKKWNKLDIYDLIYEITNNKEVLNVKKDAINIDNTLNPAKKYRSDYYTSR